MIEGCVKILKHYLSRVSARLHRLVLSWCPLCCSASVNTSNFSVPVTIEGCVKMLGNYLRRVSARLRRLVLPWWQLCCFASVKTSSFSVQAR